MNPLLERLNEKLDEAISDPGRLSAAQTVAKAAVEAIDEVDASAETIREAAISALGDALEAAEEAIAEAEQSMREGQ